MQSHYQHCCEISQAKKDQSIINSVAMHEALLTQTLLSYQAAFCFCSNWSSQPETIAKSVWGNLFTQSKFQMRISSEMTGFFTGDTSSLKTVEPNTILRR